MIGPSAGRRRRPKTYFGTYVFYGSQSIAKNIVFCFFKIYLLFKNEQRVKCFLFLLLIIDQQKEEIVYILISNLKCQCGIESITGCKPTINAFYQFKDLLLAGHQLDAHYHTHVALAAIQQQAYSNGIALSGLLHVLYLLLFLSVLLLLCYNNKQGASAFKFQKMKNMSSDKWPGFAGGQQ